MLEIEAGAKRRFADEYDAAQVRGEVVGRQGGGDTTVLARNAATAADVGLSRKAVHEARIIRDAQAAKLDVAAGDIVNAADNPVCCQIGLASRGCRPAIRDQNPENFAALRRTHIGRHPPFSDRCI